MKKTSVSRVFAILMSIMMIFTMMPGMAWAGEMPAEYGIMTVEDTGVAAVADEEGIVINTGTAASKKTNQIIFRDLSGSVPELVSTNTYEVILAPETDITKPIEIETQLGMAAAFESKNKFAIRNGGTDYISAGTFNQYDVVAKLSSGNVRKYNTAKDDGGANYFIPVWEDGVTTLAIGYASNKNKFNTSDAVTVVLKIGTGNEGPVNAQPTIVGDDIKKETADKNIEKTFDVTDKFTDPEGAELTYKYSVNSDNPEDYIDLPGGILTMSFSEDKGTSGDYILRFKANDGEKDSPVYTINLNVINNKPKLNSGIKNIEVSAVTGEPVEIDLTGIFGDLNNDPLKYKITEGDKDLEKSFEGEKYTRAYSEAGEYTIEVKAIDDDNAISDDTYTVTITVTEPVIPEEPDSETTYDVTVKVPQEFTPSFFVTASADYEQEDVLGNALVAEAGETAGGFTTWTVKVPDNRSRISYRAVDAADKSWGGMSFAVKAGDTVALRALKGVIKTLINDETPDPELAKFRVKTHENNWAASGDCGIDEEYKYLYYRYLLVAYGDNATYTYYAAPSGDLTETYSEMFAGVNPVRPDSAETEVYPLPFDIAGSFKITAPAGADVKLFNQGNYFRAQEEVCLEKHEKDGGMVEWVFLKKNGGSNMTYRVSMDGKITKAGYVDTKNTGDSITITWDETDDKADTRNVYDLDSVYGRRADDSVLLNVNAQNNLVLDVNETFTIRPFRIWEIVNSEVDNIMIEPDFTYSVISGTDVISVVPSEEYNLNGRHNRLNVTASGEGVAVVEIGYDALSVGTGEEWVYEGSYWTKTFQGKMTWNAIDPDRTGLVVVQVGNAANDVNFGIQFNDSSKRAWDAEHDTVYFLGEKGQITFAPSATNGDISEVAVSYDKGANWTVLTADNDAYIADIVSGNNILRVKKSDGTEAYQVVRGDQLTVKLTEGDRDGVIEAGEEITVSISGLHFAAGKMSGIYNPGGVMTSYLFNGENVNKQSTQYEYSCTELKVTVPADAAAGTEFSLTDGKTLSSWMGGPLGEHRNIGDSGASTNTSALGQNAVFNILPNITFTVGQELELPAEPEKENTAPVLADGVTATGTVASITTSEVYRVNLAAIFKDAENDKLTYTVSVNGGEAEEVSADYGFVPKSEGTYTLVFAANDGKLNSTETYTVEAKVTAAAGGGEEELKFDIAEKDIVGYVTISFEDNAVRKESELGSIEAALKKPIGTIVEPVRVPFGAYDTVAEVTIRLLKALGMTYDYSGNVNSAFYLSSIGNFKVDGTYYSTLSEKQAGADSGWMITLNDVFINKGASAFVVKNGDVIRWQYTCQLGGDIGDDRFSSEEKPEEEVKDVTTSGGVAGGAAGEAPTTTTPTEVTIVGSTATATVTKENVTETLKQATENKASEIILQVSAADTKGAAKVEVKLDTQTVKDIVEDTDAALTVKTENGTVSLDKETLKTVAAEAAGSTVTLEIVEVKTPTADHKEAAGENGHVIQLVIKSGNKVISLFNEGKATVTVAIPMKLDGKRVAAIHIGDDGKVEHLKGQEVTVGGKKHYRFETPHFSTFALVDAEEIGLEVEEETMSADEVKELLANLTPVVRSVKTPNKNIKATVVLDMSDKAIIEELEAEGFTVKYNFYRSTKKSSKYESMLIKEGKSYTNTIGKKGTMYFYKVRVQVYDAEGKLIARTALKQCKYAKRVWTK